MRGTNKRHQSLSVNENCCEETGSGYDAIVVGSGYGGSITACRLSEAGLRVCLIEKGRRWKAEDFPTNSFQGMLSTRVQTRNLGCYGSKTALFQDFLPNGLFLQATLGCFALIEQGDSLAMVCSGLGGGSLINAGVFAPTPMRARRDSRWPKQWEKDWHSCEAKASLMLQPEAIPRDFPIAKVMRDISGEIENSSLDAIRLSIAFKQGKNQAGLDQNACTACGNCIAGCPYNAKNSTDKNYIALAAGCEVKTECQVRFVVPTPKENQLPSCCANCVDQKPGRRWRVYSDEVEYLSADFVVLSGGVLGTAEILFQSKKRGLGLSKRLGMGFSCNGNNVAYVAGSSAPLKSYGLKKEDFVNIAKTDRPGPTISTSYTSSLGFTIQSGVLPKAYPYMLFKGIGSYGWPQGYCLLHGIIDKFKHRAKTSDCQAMILNMIGFDNSDGKITLDDGTDRIQFIPPQDPLLPRKIKAFQKLAKRLGGVLFMSRFRSTTVHLLGGCIAAQNSSLGVANSSGQVFDPYFSSSDSQSENSSELSEIPSETEPAVHPGLYICDASLIPCAVGLNPSLTIATVAEHVAIRLVDDALKYKRLVQQLGHTSEFQSLEENPIQIPVSSPELDQNGEEDTGFTHKTVDAMNKHGSYSTIYNSINQNPQTNGLEKQKNSGALVRETMHGRLGGMPCKLYLIMKMNSWIYSDSEDSIHCRRRSFGDDHPILRGRVSGHLQMKSLHKEVLQIVDGSVNMCCLDPRTPYTQYMHYHLLLTSDSGARFILDGKKTMHPFLFGSFAWSESTTLHINLRQISWNHEKWRVPDHNLDLIELQGDLRVSVMGLFQSLITMKGRGKSKFVLSLMQSLFRTYVLQRPREVSSNASLRIEQNVYPCHVLHEIKAGDGVPISCRQWKCTVNSKGFESSTRPYPVLLLNGHSTESYCLPTEPTDLIRTLLEQGYEPWLLQSRLHPLHSSNNFTIEDLAIYDIPAAFARIVETHEPNVKVHVIAHCVGGLAIHMALLGGHVSVSYVASLSCTNSSMYFDVTTIAYMKLMLPLIPISMMILGKKTVLSMFQNTEEGWRHKLLRSIAKAIPRTERCIWNECEVFSGIFGNTFWHDNITHTMHHWLNKEALPHLPMAGFPHLRSICIAGHIVDSKGKNTFLIHPERMALPTTYISGGRSLLVTPQTSLHANRYMRLHHPNFHHERVVIEGFGHSDLLIGQNSHKHVFPHILSHLKRAEECCEGCEHVKDPCYARASISWEKTAASSIGSSYGLLLLLFFFFFLVLGFFATKFSFTLTFASN
eukprot:Gb_39397 [translate_table: standard]